jgi:hypothetical protein
MVKLALPAGWNGRAPNCAVVRWGTRKSRNAHPSAFVASMLQFTEDCDAGDSAKGRSLLRELPDWTERVRWPRLRGVFNMAVLLLKVTITISVERCLHFMSFHPVCFRSLTFPSNMASYRDFHRSKCPVLGQWWNRRHCRHGRAETWPGNTVLWPRVFLHVCHAHPVGDSGLSLKLPLQSYSYIQLHKFLVYKPIKLAPIELTLRMCSLQLLPEEGVCMLLRNLGLMPADYTTWCYGT